MDGRQPAQQSDRKVGGRPLTEDMIEALTAVDAGEVSMSWSGSWGIHGGTHLALENRGLVQTSDEVVADQSERQKANPAVCRYVVVLTDAGRDALAAAKTGKEQRP